MFNRLTPAAFAVLVFSACSIAQPGSDVAFLDLVANRLTAFNQTKTDRSLASICPISQSKVARRVLAEYGAIYAATNKVIVPPVCIFADQNAVKDFQSGLSVSEVDVDGTTIQLQAPAAQALKTLLQSANALDVRIRPLDGAVAGGRDYTDTKRIWYSRVDPALEYWTRRGRIAEEEAAAFSSLPLGEQIEKIITWEEHGMPFGTNRGVSIFTSTAPPGMSQHISLIAFDVVPPVNSLVRNLFNANGWYQTVVGDVSHFTYLGLVEFDLPRRGLKSVSHRGTRYWVPNIVDQTTITPSN